ncbi:4'-phosphopantetheinyl transferase superfamily protein [Mesorhizobium sp. M1D.F.Ca.ET.234.01.1.1]|uniref:4'-phosphopantetheinyl transferase family protein n=1 Tax=Mesorhizobium sp. M1D.F.Ca.ET.234.01.1.1 TaxID=2563932 RepID=UPI000FCA9177|nr:4'-phosphopantetheinyl transferase superfamily protein [Mesorhizobium sp. M1D.F.Ca.ET.234.01.1.1]TGP24315.1 4'-phosphopantetheinyl transferase [Mesorhizobium sp. M1D.F.Ca.ET.231.01.1.1]TGP35490.1 4'-phosphopantetheinyl transferase [Mesorhizobium sp. M1D.F.Ca.ET.234.01.1.1]TGS49120.1 4'-phosphopantetheinyl transferase [Mesorhizobium sp. M1D.F.Ca.ET.184.01.1.1]TGS63711.1 4'-phosphopantetheinyl transferase [Mesorhizobium sp. M1D.F.Ca.ET.183.01.1.1]
MHARSDSTPPAIAVDRALVSLAPPGVLTGCRRIQMEDERYLLPAERASIATRGHKARAASGAGRRIAHELLGRLGSVDIAVTRGGLGNPIWPPGTVGSIAHDDEMAVAVAARTDAMRSVGVDVEPALPLPADLLPIVAAPQDRLGDLDPGMGGRILFAVKEAVYKASFPLDGRVLGFEDIAIDFETGEAVTSSGLRLTVRFAISPRILALAYPAR